jgi:hypothetical protein
MPQNANVAPDLMFMVGLFRNGSQDELLLFVPNGSELPGLEGIALRMLFENHGPNRWLLFHRLKLLQGQYFICDEILRRQFFRGTVFAKHNRGHLNRIQKGRGPEDVLVKGKF